MRNIVDSLYITGLSQFENSAYDEAIDSFTEAYDIAESLDWLTFYPDLPILLSTAYINSTDGLSDDECLERYNTALEYIETVHNNDSTVLFIKNNIKYNVLATKSDIAAKEAEKTEDYTLTINLTEEALEIYSQLYGKENDEYAYSLNLLAVYCNKNYDNFKAIEYEEEALSISQRLHGKDRNYAEGLINLAIFYSSTGNSTKAIICGENALELISKENDNSRYRSLLSDLCNYYSNIGDYSRALAYGKEAIGIHDVTEENSYQTLIALEEVAKIQIILENYTDALENIQKALKINSQIPDPDIEKEISLLLLNADCHLNLGNLEIADEIISNALDLCSTNFGNESITYANVLNKLSYIRFFEGNNIAATDAVNKALGIIKINSESSEENTISNSLAIRNVVTAIKCIHSLVFIAREIYDNEADIKGLITMLDAYLQALDSKMFPFQSSLLASDIAYFYEKLKDYDSAIKYDLLNIDILSRIKNSNDYAYALYALALDYDQSKDHSKAIETIKETVGISDGLSDKTSLRIMSRITLASFYEHSGNIPEFKKTAVEATEIAKGAIRHSFIDMTGRERKFFWEQYREWFEKDVHRYAYHYRSDSLVGNAYNAILLSKGILLNSEIEFDKVLRETEDAETVSLYEEWKRILRDIDYSIRIQSDSHDIDSLKILSYGIEKKLLKASKLLGDYTRNLTLEWKDIRDNLSDNEASIEFASFPVGKDSTLYAAYIIKNNSNCPQLVPLFEESQIFVKDRYDWYNTTYLSNLIWSPLKESLDGVDTVYFSPSGELYNIAIEYLPDSDGNGTVSDSRTYYRLSSTREIIDKNNYGIDKAIVYGGLEYSNTTISSDVNSTSPKYLPATKEEAEAIGKLLSDAGIETKVRTGAEGTEASFKNLSGGDIGLIHMATHGFYWSGKEDRRNIYYPINGNIITSRLPEDKAMTSSGLILSYSQDDKSTCDSSLYYGNDGILTAQEISRMDLRKLNLVILSACQTGLGEITGDGVWGLQRGFKMAGAKTLLMSLWDVDDEATSMLMKEFYSNLISGKDKLQALRLAQESLINYEVEVTVNETEDIGFIEKFRQRNEQTNTVKERKYKYHPYSAPRYWASFILTDAI